MNRYLNPFIGLFLFCLLLIGVLFCAHSTLNLSKKQTLRSPHHKHEYNDFFFATRNYPEVKPNVEAYLSQLQAINKAKNKPLPKTADDWRLEGPKNLGGRVNSVAIHPSNFNIMYAGSSKGGIFKTINGGLNWQPIFDDQTLISIGKIVLDPTNPNVIYAGTGDVNISAFPSIGNGMYKSINGGLTWQYMGLAHARVISDIYVNPKNTQEIYVAAMGLPFKRNADRGVYKTSDGGKTWKQVLFVSNEVGIIDLAVHPQNANIAYAVGWNRIRNNKESVTSGSGAKVFKTTNGGISWKTLKGGLPQGNFSRVAIAISPTNPNKLYVTYINSAHGYDSTYKTVNAGDSWTKFADNNKQEQTYGGPGKDFGWYFGKIRIDPTDDNIVYILGVDLWKVTNSGQKWEYLIDDVLYDVHPDFHDLQFINSSTVIAATDGGLYRGDKDFTGLWKWKDVDDIPNSQFYRVAVNPHQTGVYGGGLQDNGSSQGSFKNINNWARLWGGDGFTMQYHPTDPTRIFMSTQHGYIYYVHKYGENFNNSAAGFTWKNFNNGIDTKDRSNWDSPFLISQHNSKVMYKGTYRMYKTANDTIANWKPISSDLTDGVTLHERFHTISSIDESPLNPSILLAGTVDANVWITTDGAKNWEAIHYGLPTRYITSVKASYKNDQTIYVTQSGYKNNDNHPYIFKSSNQGKCWVAINGNLPAVAINDLAIYNNGKDNILFAATDGGVFYSNNGGYIWWFMGSQMPLVPVYDIEIDSQAKRLIAGTFARSMYSYPIQNIITNGAHSISQLDTIPPALSVAGPKIITLQPGQSFTVPAATAIDNIDCDLTNSIQKRNNVNLEKTGIYFVTFTVSDSAGNTAVQTIQVNIAGNAPPQLNINSPSSISFWQGTTYFIPHASAHDDVDGDLSYAIKVNHNININVPGIYIITFSITDSSNKTTSQTINVYIIKDEPPTIKIDGDHKITVNQYSPFQLPTITAADDVDGDLTHKIDITNDKINVTVPGTYVVKISVEDSFGNITTADLTVEVTTISALNTNEILANELVKIHPNPVENIVYFMVKNQAHQITECMLFDAAGKLLIQQHFKPELNVAHLNAGLYYCTFKTSEQAYFTLPLVKQ